MLKPLRLMLLPIIFFILLADVIASVFVADVITTCYSMRRCLLMADVISMYIVVNVKTTKVGVIAYFILFYLADVIANISVADVITTYYSTRWWQMLLPGGRWNSHCRVGGY